MSSLIDASVTVGQGTPNEDCDSGIIHFDATQRRKEKMRKKSHDAPAAEATPPPAPPPPPAAKAPEPATPPAPAKPASNGAANLDGYTTPQPPKTLASVSALSQLSGKELETFLIDFVVEQTGYPPEMVELDADLEADLGIDSIKKAQLFGELAEQFEIALDVTDESLSLDDFPTLAHVMEFLQSQAGSDSTTTAAEAPVPTEPAAPVETTPVPATTVSATPSANGNGIAHPDEPATSTGSAGPSVANALAGVDLETFLVDFVVEQTGYPPEMVELDADLEADLGIDSIKKAQLFGELAEQFEITVDMTDESLSLDDFPTLRHVMEFLQSAESATAPTASQSPPTQTPKPATPPQPAANGSHSHGAAANGSHSNGSHSHGAAMKAEPEPKPAAETASVTGLSQEDLETFLVDFVVEQTGYPPEMVELDADLEADLGIDSIKKAQMMGELAEQFEITVDVTDENLSLDDFPTLRHVCEFLASPGKVSA